MTALSPVPALAPIALFVYNRPMHAARALHALKACPEAADSPLFVFCDGPRSDAAWPNIRATRDAVRRSTEIGFAEVTLYEAPANIGCAQSIIRGVTDLCQRFGRVIVVEDDLIVSPHFLGFMNAGLTRYGDTPQIMQIGGYVFGAGLDETAPADAIFLPFTTSWGWATWQRAWEYFDPTMAGYPRVTADPATRRRFNLGGAVNYARMITLQQTGRIDAWDIRWYLSVFLHNGLVLYPRRSIVSNGGMDGSGSHCDDVLAYQPPVALDRPVTRWPERVETSSFALPIIVAAMAEETRRSTPSLGKRVRRGLYHRAQKLWQALRRVSRP